MSRMSRDRFDPEHARARELAATRIGEALDPDDAGWLDTHLAWCAPCRAVAGEYESQRLELRALRLDAPVPPRDLWARTSAALELERARKGVSTERTPSPAPSVRATPRTTATVRGRSSFPVGALSGAIAVVFVVGVTVLGGRDLLRTTVPTANPSQGSALTALGTPFPLSPRDVSLLVNDGGSLSISRTNVDKVCPLDIGPRCTSMQLGSRLDVNVSSTERVREAVKSPTDSHVVIVQHADGQQSSSDVVVVPVIPKPSEPAATPTPSDTPPPSDTTGSLDPASPSPTPDVPGSPDPSPSDEPGATPEATPSDAPPSAEPSEPPTSGDPSEPPSSLPVESPTADPDGPITIAADVIVVGRTAAYNREGTAFAFTARPTDGSHGPDVYVWQVGTAAALPVTDDHESIFSGWVGDRVLLSRSNPDGDPLVAARGDVPMSLLLDPATGAEVAVSEEPMFRPAVDPRGRAAVWWDGAIEVGADGFGWQPRSGRLLLGTWVEPGSDDAGAASRPEEDVLASGPVPDWDARWDETGSKLAVWIASREDPSTGRLSLFVIDQTTGRLDPDHVLLDEVTAAPGYSIEKGRLVWLSPTAGGETRIEVLAWAGEDVGQVELTPGQEALIIVR